MPQAKPTLQQRIQRNRREAQRLLRMSRNHHLRAARVAQRALVAHKNGRPVLARKLMQHALDTKARAVRLRVRATRHQARVRQLRQARARRAAA